MSLYPITVKRCQHIKVNGTQCGSPALRDSKFCYYHIRFHWPELEALENNNGLHQKLPTLEDANSIQLALAQVMERLIMQEVDHKTAALLLYALQVASTNLCRTSLEPAQPTLVVIDRDSVAHRPLGVTAWSKEKGREYDIVTESTGQDEDWGGDGPSLEDDRYDSMFDFLIARQLALHPGMADTTLGELKDQQPH